MWLIFAFLSLLNYAVTDLFGKRCVDDGDSLVPVKLSVSSSAISFVISIILYIFGFGESGMTPWQILYHNPLIIVNMLCFILQWVVYLLSMKYINLSISEAISGSTGVFYFVGLVFLNLFIGKFPAVREILHPLRLIPVILVLGFIFLYPNVERFAKKRAAESVDDLRKSRHKFNVGVCILIFSLILDSLDSLTTTLIIDDGSVGTVDYIMASYFSTILPISVFSVFIRAKNKKWHIPVINDNRYAKCYCITALMSSVLYITASYFDAVRTGILFLAYPIVPIIGAKLILKEKHTWRQNLCIWVITFSAIAFCVFDYLL